MNVCYCCDSGGGKGLEASVYSLLTYTKNVNIYVFTMQYERNLDNGVVQVFPALENEQKESIRKIIAYLDPKGSHVIFVDMLKYYQELFLNGCHENDGHSSPYATLKLCFDKVCLNLHDILYLDCDTIIQGDLNPMYRQYLDKTFSENKCYAAYRVNPNEEEKSRGYKGEMVAAVILFNLDLCRQNNFFEKVRYNVTHKFYRWYEQSAIEDTADCVILPEKYNYMEAYEDRDYEPVILHFSNRLFPKLYFSTDKQFYQKYPHLNYIKKGLALVKSLDLKYHN